MITRAIQAANSIGIFISWFELVGFNGEVARLNGDEGLKNLEILLTEPCETLRAETGTNIERLDMTYINRDFCVADFRSAAYELI